MTEIANAGAPGGGSLGLQMTVIVQPSMSFWHGHRFRWRGFDEERCGRLPWCGRITMYVLGWLFDDMCWKSGIVRNMGDD